jgi:hypothetical protein
VIIGVGALKEYTALAYEREFCLLRGLSFADQPLFGIAGGPNAAIDGRVLPSARVEI